MLAVMETLQHKNTNWHTELQTREWNINISRNKTYLDKLDKFIFCSIKED